MKGVCVCVCVTGISEGCVCVTGISEGFCRNLPMTQR